MPFEGQTGIFSVGMGCYTLNVVNVKYQTQVRFLLPVLYPAPAGYTYMKETLLLSDDDNEIEYLVMEKSFGKHPMKTLAFQDGETWRAILRCDLCIRHMVFVQIDPSSNEDMTLLHAEMQMHATGMGDRLDDGWHEGLGFTDSDD